MDNNVFGQPTKEEAKKDILKLQAAKLLAKNNDFACEICIAGLKIGISLNERVIPILNQEIAEINKFLRGQKNTWE